jgi:hypothetical protein
MPPKKTVKTGGATGGATGGGTDSSDDDKTVTVGLSHAEVENVIGQRLAQQQAQQQAALDQQQAAIDDRLGNMQAQMQAQMQQMMAMLQGLQAAGAAGAVQNQPPPAAATSHRLCRKPLNRKLTGPRSWTCPCWIRLTRSHWRLQDVAGKVPRLCVGIAA